MPGSVQRDSVYLKEGMGRVRTDFTEEVPPEPAWLEHTNMGRMEGKQGCRGLRYEAGVLRFSLW